MRAKEFILKEDAESDQIEANIKDSEQHKFAYLDSQIDEVSDIIKRSCAPYLSTIGGIENALFNAPLYRGFKRENVPEITTHNPLMIIPIRTDRKPMDTPPNVQANLDNWFQKNTGYKFRSAGLFCSGREFTAVGYGYLTVVIPRGEFHYCWSKKYSDLYESLELAADEYWYEAEHGDPHEAMHLSHKEKIKQVFDDLDSVSDFMDNGNYLLDSDLFRALSSGHEIMVVCKDAIILDHTWTKMAKERLRGKSELGTNLTPYSQLKL